MLSALPYPFAPMDVAVVIVGDEILSGHVQDANTHFIAGRLAHHGHRLRRVVVVPDDPERIADELRRDLDVADLVITCGGLGPTHDDRTMEGVALALGRELEICEPLSRTIEALVQRVRDAGFSHAAFGVDGLRKMALAPAGAEVLPCSIGVVPAIVVQDARGVVCVLPGPPRELQTVFLESVEPRFLEGTGASLTRDEITHPFPESTLAKVLTELAARFPETSIGSYPQSDHTLIRVAGPADETAKVSTEIRAAIDELHASEEGKRLLDFLRRRRR